MADMREMGFIEYTKKSLKEQLAPARAIKTVTRRILQHATRKEHEDQRPGFLRQVVNDWKIRARTRLQMYFQR